MLWFLVKKFQETDLYSFRAFFAFEKMVALLTKKRCCTFMYSTKPMPIPRHIVFYATTQDYLYRMLYNFFCKIV